MTSNSRLPDEHVELAARLLLEARHEKCLATALPVAAAPRTEEDAYAIQDLVRAKLGPTIGWKTGAPSPTARPIAAPLLRRFYAESPARLEVNDFNIIGLEAELAFTLGKDLTPASVLGDPQAVVDAVASVHAAIEIVDTRLPHWETAPALWKLADNQSNGFFVLGSGTHAWREHDLPNAAVQLCIDGKVIVERSGGNAAGDPIRLLLWLIEHSCRHRGGLRKGDVVTTGTYTGMHFIDGPAEIQVGFPGIGTAEVAFVA